MFLTKQLILFFFCSFRNQNLKKMVTQLLLERCHPQLQLISVQEVQMVVTKPLRQDLLVLSVVAQEIYVMEYQHYDNNPLRLPSSSLLHSPCSSINVFKQLHRLSILWNDIHSNIVHFPSCSSVLMRFVSFHVTRRQFSLSLYVTLVFLINSMLWNHLIISIFFLWRNKYLAKMNC